MPGLNVKTADGDHYIEFSPGLTLKAILDTTGFRVRSGCGGAGACGLCRVRIAAAKVDAPNMVEFIHLTDDQIASGIRLACQIRPTGDMEVHIPDTPPVSTWKAILPPKTFEAISNAARAFPAPGLPANLEHPCGIAVDLGTTHISVSFHDLLTGKWITGRRGLNPQAEHGSDVMTRLMAAQESPRLAGTMRMQAIEAIGSAVLDVASREGIAAERIARMVLVANTAMTGLLSGKNHHLLLDPAYWMSEIDCLPENPEDLPRELGIHPIAQVRVIPPLAGFVGSDLLAGCIALNLVGADPGSLFIDFGTNSEIALWDGNVIRVTSAAGGPAFEGCGIGCGMPAEPGAVYQVLGREEIGTGNGIVQTDVSGIDLRFRTIDGKEPLGLCGSGIVDLIACLVRSKVLTRIGRFAPGMPPGGLKLLDGEHKLWLNVKDIDMFQRAKSAIIAGVRVLMSMSGMKMKDLRRIFVGGAFGHFLNRENAVNIGLLPDIDRESIELCGNTALRGCEELLMCSDPMGRIAALRDRMKIINLARSEEFEDFFIDGLYLDRWPAGE